MKLAKMSLAAALLLSASAYAIDNVKVSGDAKLYYHTQDDSNDGTATGDNGNSLFNKKGAMGQAALGLGITADLTEGVSSGAHLTALSTLGLENQLVNGVWEGTNGVDDSFWFDEVWMAATAGKTTAKVGRMALDTPLVFSETWSITKNTFEAAVLINQDIADTTLVGAFVGGSNGAELGGGQVVGNMNAAGNTNFHQFYDGAYAVGAVNNSWKPLTAQAWYYNAQADGTPALNGLNSLQAYWLQADVDMEGILLGAQYTSIDYNVASTTFDNNAFAVMAGYAMKDVVTVKVAYSQTGEEKDSTLALGAGGNLAASGQSKLYTEAWWNYGYITQADTSAINVAVSGNVADYGLAAYYTATDADANGAATDTRADMTELTLEVTRSVGPLDVSLLYIMTDAEDQNNKAVALDGDAFNTVQAYLTYNF